ncbi:MAG: hypothetical protein U9Q20_06845 [Campylobacterota bacterium]|nr:hypothetical protein [Campylobacterota bacterium]
MKIFFYTLFFVLFITGCSSKQYYEPKDVDGNYTAEVVKLDTNTISYTPYGMTLENKKLISKSGITDLNISKEHHFLNENSGVVLASDKNGTLFLKENNTISKYKFSKDVVAATINDNLIALVLMDNSILLYDKETKTTKFREYYKKSLINNTKIAAPVFLSSVILYPTLDGKVVVFDLASSGVAKTINIDPTSDINNIIFLEAIDDTLVAATNNKIFTFSDKRINVKDFEIRDVIIDKEKIYISTLDGQIIKFDKDLNQLKSTKLRFAKIYTIVATKDYIYAVESQDFLIKFDKSLEKKEVYNFSFDEYEKVIAIDNKLYFEDGYTILK